MKRGILLLPLLLVTGLIDDLAGYAIPTSSHCKQEDEHFICHKTYSFNYKAETVVTTPSSTKEKGAAQIECKVHLNAEGDCKYTLKVESCSISEKYSQLLHDYSNPLDAKSKQFSTAMEKYLIGFTMSEGVVEGIMAHPSEPPSILNFKRGIISAFITKKRVWKDKVVQGRSELRSDVQGVCPVKYRVAVHYGEPESRIYMSKDASRCYFPSRTDSPYSPFSLIWNTSFVHNHAIQFDSGCQYKFNEAGILNTTECYDRYSLEGRVAKSRGPFTAVETAITQKLTLSEQSALKSESVYKTLDDYRLKQIQYEFETIEHQHEILPDTKERVHGLLDKLLTDPEKPINPNSVDLFDELVELLRHSAPLNNVIDHCWVSSTCTDNNYPEKEIQLGKIWTTALIQCNRVHCTQAFRSMLDWDTNYLQHVVTNTDLDWIFVAWSNAKITDFHHIETIIDIVEHKYTNRFSIAVLSSMIYNLRKTHTDEELRQHSKIEAKHRSTLENLLTFIKKPIGEGCYPTNGYKNIDVAAALQAYANVVPLYEFVSGQRLDLDIFQKCIIGKEDHWPISVSALQATRHTQTTKELHTLLWKALKDPSLRHEDHVIAYKVLAEKFGGAVFVEEIVNFLEESAEKGLEYNLRTYIVTHLRTVAKDREPRRAEFSKAIRKAMVYEANLFRALPDEKPTAETKHGKNAEYHSRHIPWDIRIDDDVIFDQGHFSKYDEEHITYGMSIFGGFGYGVASSILFKEGSVFPYAIWINEYIKMFGQKYNVSQVGMLTKGLEEFFKAISSHFKNENYAIKSWESFTHVKEIFENFADGTQLGSKLQSLKFPYGVNENILRHLNDLQKEKVKDIPETGQSLDLVYQFGFFDNYLFQTSLNEIPELASKFLTAFSARMNTPYKSKPLVWKIIEAETVIPTIIGIPLNWTTDAYWFSNSKVETKQSSKLDFNEEVEFNISGSFSGLATLNLGMYLDLPGYASYGADSVSTVSTNVGATVHFKLDVNHKKFSVQLELPQRPMQLLSYKRSNFLLRHYQVENIPDATENRQSENRCSYSLSSLLGFKLCHSHSYVRVTDKDYWKQCSSLAGDSYWNYTTDYIAKHKVALQFTIHSERVDNRTIIEADVKSRDPKNADKFNTIVKWSHKVKKGEFKSQITAPVLPTFNFQATRDPLGDDGYHVQLTATIHPGETTYFDLKHQETSESIAESTMKSPLSSFPSSKQVAVPVATTTLNFTNKYSYYGYDYKSHEFPESTLTDYKFQYKSLKESYKSLPSIILKHRYFWEEDGNAWLKFHREVKIVLKDDDYIRQSYNVIKLPKSTVKLTAYYGPAPDANLSFAFNLTDHDPGTNRLQHFINFTSSVEHESEDKKSFYVMKANTTMPLISMATMLKLTHEMMPIPDMNITWIITKEQLKYKPNNNRPELKWWAPNTDAFTSEKTIVQSNFKMKADSSPEWKTIADRTREEYASVVALASKEYYYRFAYFKVDLSEPKFEIDFQSKPTYVSFESSRYKRHFAINSPTKKFSYEADLSVDLSLQSEYFLWKSTLRRPDDELTFYLFNITSPPAQGFVYVTEDLNSEALKRNVQLAISYQRPFGEISIHSQSPVEPLLNLELKAKYTPERTSIKAKHHFVDIDLESTRLHSYASKTDFKSKNTDVIPNMQWLVEYPNVAEGLTLTFKFPDVSKTYYVFGLSDLNATRLVIDLCYEKNCAISDIDSDNFIAEIELSLEDPQILTRTVSYNPQAVKDTLHVISERIFKTVRGLADYFNGPYQGKSIIIELYRRTKDVIKVVLYETIELFLPYLYGLGENFFETFAFAFNTVRSIATYVQPSSSESAGYSWCSYVADKQQFFRREIEDRILDGLYTPGPIPDKSYVVKTLLPVYWTQFNRFPLQLSPLFHRKIQETGEELPFVDDGPSNRFYDEKYDRHALFTSSGDIYTFDNRVRHFKQYLRGPCSYLLSHDYDEGKFSIYYYYPNVHFLFPDMSLTIGPTGKVYINETYQVDLPLSSWNGNIRMVRKENSTELITTYDLKVVCSINNFYCVFYTTDNKFNAVIGLLGNNNHNPLDEPSDVQHYELSGSYMCRGTLYPYLSQESSSDSSFAFHWFDLLWKPNSPTLACHDIVSPTDVFASAYLDTPYVPCSLMDGYLALCGAKDVTVGRSPCFKCKSQYAWNSHWDNKVERKIDIVFIIDLTYKKSSKNFLKGLESLAVSIERQFVLHNGYRRVAFGLVGYKGKGQWKEPQQHTMNGKLIGNIEDFVKYGLKTLTFDGPKSRNLTTGISAIEFAAEHYNLGDTSTHVYIIMTPEDTPIEGFSSKKIMRFHETAFQTLHVFSNYEEIADRNLFGKKVDGTAFSQVEGKFNIQTKPGYPVKHPAPYPKGPLAELAGLTKGSAWQLPYLEKDEPQSKVFNNLVSLELFEKSRAQANHCRECYCTSSNSEQPHINCLKTTCKEPAA